MSAEYKNYARAEPANTETVHAKCVTMGMNGLNGTLGYAGGMTALC